MSAAKKLELAEQEYNAAMRAHVETKDAAAAATVELRSKFDALENAKREHAAQTPVDRSQKTLTDGSPVTDDHRELQANGQQKGYVVLSAAERAKGFVRPLRDTYVHVGPPTFKSTLRDLTEEEKTRYGEFNYVKFEQYPGDSTITGRFWTQAQLDKIGKGCGLPTSMSRPLAETYARDPSFYGGTFCSFCGTHFPVGANGEFVWQGTDQRVGT